MEASSQSSNPRDLITRISLKFYRYRTLIKRRWWVLTLTIGLGLAIEGWFLMTKAEMYESIGKLMLGGTFNIPEGQQYREDSEGYLGNQEDLLQNPEVLEMARRRVAVEYPDLTGKVKLKIDQIPRTTIFEITGTGKSPEYTHAFVEALMQSFIQYKNAKRQESSTTQTSQIGEQLAKIKEEQVTAAQELKNFAEKNDMAAWDEQGKIANRFLTDLKTQQAMLNTELNRLETLGAEALLSSPAIASSSAVPTGEDGTSSFTGDITSQYANMRQQLVAKQAELAERSQVWKPAHPAIQAIKAEVAGIERSISAIKDITKETAEGRIKEIRSALVALEKDIESWKEKALDAGRLTAEYERLKGQVTRLDGRYDKLLTNMTSIGTSQEITRDPLTISQHATAAELVPPRPIQHLATGAVIGLLLGLGILHFLDRTDDRISSSSEMIEYFPEAILGQIPNVEESRNDAGLPLLAPEDQRFAFAEAFRSLRSSLVFMPNQGEMKTIIITSAIPGEGKSTIASNLAITMALAGARVLLVDADLRRGDLASLFDIDGRFGLSSVLRGEIPWKSAVQPTRHSTLSIIPRGPVTNQSGELLLVPLVDQLLTDFKKEYDLTIFNTSPILATDDTPTLAPNFDGTLMVIRAGFTSARLTQNAMNLLYQRQVNVLGMILNSVDTGMPDYYYYRYPKYYAA